MIIPIPYRVVVAILGPELAPHFNEISLGLLLLGFVIYIFFGSIKRKSNSEWLEEHQQKKYRKQQKKWQQFEKEYKEREAMLLREEEMQREFGTAKNYGHNPDWTWDEETQLWVHKSQKKK